MFIKTCIIATLCFLAGCTHYLYQGDFTAENNLGNNTRYRLYWTKTEPLIGTDSAESMVLLTECSTPVTFTESEQGIRFEAPADQYISVNDQTGQSIICAKVDNLPRVVDYDSGDVIISVYCTPVDDEFSAVKLTFLSINNSPYRIPVVEKSEFSILGASLEPVVLTCPDG